MIRVIIADDHHLVRQGIRALLDLEDNITVVAEADTGEEAVSLVAEYQPDVLIMDLSMPRLDGVQAAKQILRTDTHTQIIILSMHDDVFVIKQLIDEGVKGYLLKNTVADELMLAIQAVSEGKLFLSPTISDAVMLMLMSPDKVKGGDVADLLTPREHEVLQLVVEGHTNSEIAEILTISVKTVEKHRANVMSKLEVNDLASLILAAVRHHLVFVDE
ncbi:MAG TPA: response regulator transcription factor [Anaerolineae bacterium]|nr:response regulator transcription factor [Anaerolineae bacterium]